MLERSTSNRIPRSLRRAARRASGLTLAASLLLAPLAGAQEEIPEGRAALGKRLFEDLNFTNQAADYGASCSGCHASGSEVQGREPRVWADYTPQSLTATKNTTLRNTPSLQNAGTADHLGWDGASTDLEQLILEKLVGDMMGWEPKDRERALAAIQFTLLEEGSGGGTGPSYAEEYQAAYGEAFDAASPEATVKQGARAIADFVRTLNTNNKAPWDAFAEMNRLDAPNDDEDPKAYAYGVWSRIGNQEGRRLIKRPRGFSADAYMGFRTFFRVDDVEPGAVGNCVSCHVPPAFTDGKFHNVGISEMEYDGVHGEGAAAKLGDLDPAGTKAATPTASDARAIDLGRAHVDGDRASRGAFRTPSLRNSAGTDPYMHNGRYESLQAAVEAHAKASELARAGQLPWASPEIALIQLTPEDIQQLVAFLQQLNEGPPEEFRNFLIKLARDELTYDW